MRSTMTAVAVVGLLASVALAERPPEPRGEADLVVVGKIHKISTKKSTWGGDGVSTAYTAEVEVEKVEKGKAVRDGETIRIGWFRVTKSPSQPLPGAYGHSYPIKAKDRARFWLMGSKKAGWKVIYNSEGVEKLKK